MAPSKSLVELIAVMCESILLGAYGVLIILVFWILTKGWKTMPQTHKYLFFASILMFVISIVHLGLVIQQITATVLPIANYRAQVSLAAIQFMIGDIILIWRVWVIWGRNYYVAAGPLLIMLVAGGLTFNLAAGGVTSSFFTEAPVALIVANTFICVILFSGRVWYMRREVRKFQSNDRSGHYMTAVALIVESGVLYALTQLTSLILSHTATIGLAIMLDLEIPLIGILPTLVIVFVHFDMVVSSNTTFNNESSNFRNKSHVTMATFRARRPTSTTASSTTERAEFKGDKSHPVTFDSGDQPSYIQKGRDVSSIV